jgi:4-aminobutyrate aminotransferase-like enzyme
VRNRYTLEPAKEETSRLINLIRGKGVLVGREGEGGNIIKIRPPIVLTSEHAAILAEIRAMLPGQSGRRRRPSRWPLPDRSGYR